MTDCVSRELSGDRGDLRGVNAGQAGGDRRVASDCGGYLNIGHHR